MKKRIIISATTLVILGILLFGFTNLKSNKSKEIAATEPIEPLIENNAYFGPYEKPFPNLYYGVDARFEAVKKSDIQNATSIYDFISEEEKSRIIAIKSVNLVIIKNNQLSELQELGTSGQLTDAQLQLLKSTDYFNHFTIRTEFKGKDKETGKIKDLFYGPHITVVPEQQAQYKDGKEALLNYFKDYSRKDINIVSIEQLNAIKISFIVNTEGKVTNVKHDAMSTGYPSIDKKMMALVKNIPGEWIPAQKANGEKIDQELVFTFGLADGC